MPVRPISSASALRWATAALAIGLGATLAAQAQQGDGGTAKPKAPDEPKSGAPADSVDSQADLAFWNSVKDRSKPEELRAYLQQFPEGRFAALAKLRLKEAEEGQAKGNTAGLATDVDLVREIQDRLYKLNYAITRFDGSLDDTTDRAIKTWQTRNQLPASGTLSAAQLKVLREAVPASTWGALAYPPVGLAVPVHGKASRQAAESEALAACKAKNNDVACKVFAAPATECVAVSTYRAKLADGRTLVMHVYGRGIGATPSAQRSMQVCGAHPQRAGNRCLLIGIACGTGSISSEELNKLLPPDAQQKPAPKPKSKDQDT